MWLDVKQHTTGITKSHISNSLFAITTSDCSFDPYPGDGGANVTQSANMQDLEHTLVEGDLKLHNTSS